MVRRELCADVEERILGDAELDQLRLRLDLGLAEMAALRLAAHAWTERMAEAPRKEDEDDRRER